MDNFWDIKGLLEVFLRVLTVVGCDSDFVEKKATIIKGMFDKQQTRTIALFADNFFFTLFEKETADNEDLKVLEETFFCSKAFILDEIKILKA